MKERLLLKVCGMRESSNMLDIASCKPAFMGFIFYEQSPRYVGQDFIIPSNFPLSIKRVGVFVNESTQIILELVAQHNLDFVQLHGNESLKQVIELREHKCGIIKVFSIDDDFDFGKTSEFEGSADYFLFDTKGKFYGGNAQRFNWKLLEQYKGSTTFLLSGGILPDHMNEIIKIQHPKLIGIDVNSGVESSPGIKNLDKVTSIVKLLTSNF